MVREVVLLAALFLLCVRSERGAYRSLVVPQLELHLPDLPYPHEGLEPLLDAATLKVHHQGHHKAYTVKTNAALKEWREQDSSALSSASMVEILQRLPEVPEKWRERIRNNGGGFANHIFYWETMAPRSESQGEEPNGQLAEDIGATFGSWESFRAEFSGAAGRLFGSGYVWLCEDSTGALSIQSTHNQDSPLTSGLYPLLVLDVWEHAYYLKHQNRRSEYIVAWWEVVCWACVESIREFWHHHRDNHTHTHQDL